MSNIQCAFKHPLRNLGPNKMKAHAAHLGGSEGRFSGGPRKLADVGPVISGLQRPAKSPSTHLTCSCYRLKLASIFRSPRRQQLRHLERYYEEKNEDMDTRLATWVESLAAHLLPKIRASLADKEASIDLATAENWVIRDELAVLYQRAMSENVNASVSESVAVLLPLFPANPWLAPFLSNGLRRPTTSSGGARASVQQLFCPRAPSASASLRRYYRCKPLPRYAAVYYLRERRQCISRRAVLQSVTLRCRLNR